MPEDEEIFLLLKYLHLKLDIATLGNIFAATDYISPNLQQQFQEVLKLSLLHKSEVVALGKITNKKVIIFCLRF